MTAKKSKRRRRHCLHCDNKEVSRGLCRTHLAVAMDAKRSGKTDQQLVDEEYMLPMKMQGRPPKRRRKAAVSK